MLLVTYYRHNILLVTCHRQWITGYLLHGVYCYWLNITDSVLLLVIYQLLIKYSVMLLVTYYIHCNVTCYLLQIVLGQTLACGSFCTSCTMSSRGTLAASPSTSSMSSPYSRGRGCS